MGILSNEETNEKYLKQTIFESNFGMAIYTWIKIVSENNWKKKINKILPTKVHWFQILWNRTQNSNYLCLKIKQNVIKFHKIIADYITKICDSINHLLLKYELLTYY
jgi:hypothetical protein